MSRVLVAGVGPLPEPAQTRVFAPGLRLQSISRTLARAGHEVFLAALNVGWGEVGKQSDSAVTLLDWEKLPAFLSHEKPCVVALTEVASHRLLPFLAPELPLAVDYNGHPMVERQQQAAVHGSDAALLDQWLLVLPVLLRADVFFSCSGPQRHALLGELGAAGRLNKDTCGFPLVEVLPPPVTFEEPFHPDPSPLLRGPVVPHDARVLLFTGGYNTWLDHEKLFQVVEATLEKLPDAHFVSTGGAIEGHVTLVFEKFQSLLAHSRFRERYHFVGWLSHRDFERACLEADVGISIDLDTLEAELGFRNRFHAYIWGGMRCVSTGFAEGVRKLASRQLVVTPPADKIDILTESVVQELAAGRFDELGAAHRRSVLLEDWAPAVTYQRLLAWVSNPDVAPDRRGGAVGNNLAQFQRRALRQGGKSGTELAQRLRGSRLMAPILATHPEMRRLVDEILSAEPPE